MSDNPLEDNQEREARIRTRAYLLWEQAGNPMARTLSSGRGPAR